MIVGTLQEYLMTDLTEQNGWDTEVKVPGRINSYNHIHARLSVMRD